MPVHRICDSSVILASLIFIMLQVLMAVKIDRERIDVDADAHELIRKSATLHHALMSFSVLTSCRGPDARHAMSGQTEVASFPPCLFGTFHHLGNFNILSQFKSL